MTIGITGATGQLGALIVAKLKALLPNDDIVALVRSPEKAHSLGVAARHIDYDQPSTLEAAFVGLDKLLLISSSELGKRTEQHGHVIDSAKRAGVSRLVYTSVLRAETSALPVAAEHRATEAAIRASGLGFTILRNGWYTENYTGFVPGAVVGGRLYGAAGDAKLSTATREDYADAAVAVLTTMGHVGATYELAGDDAFTLTDLAAEISKQAQVDVAFNNLTEQAFAAKLADMGIDQHFAAAIASWEAAAADGALFDDRRELSRLIGRPTTPLANAVAASLGASATE